MNCIDCKKLVYHPIRQEAISPADNCLVKWDLATHIPRILDILPLSFGVGTIPAVALIEAADAIAVAPKTTSEAQNLELRRWQNG